MTEAKTTTDHDEIRKWAEERGGRPATVSSTATDDTTGVLRIDFEPEVAEGLERVDWDDFFDKFDSSNLRFLYQEKTADGGISRFHKFVYPEQAS